MLIKLGITNALNVALIALTPPKPRQLRVGLYPRCVTLALHYLVAFNPA